MSGNEAKPTPDQWVRRYVLFLKIKKMAPIGMGAIFISQELVMLILALLILLCRGRLTLCLRTIWRSGPGIRTRLWTILRSRPSLALRLRPFLRGGPIVGPCLRTFRWRRSLPRSRFGSRLLRRSLVARRRPGPVVRTIHIRPSDVRLALRGHRHIGPRLIWVGPIVWPS